VKKVAGIFLTVMLLQIIFTGSVFSQINEDWQIVREKYGIPEYIERFSSNGFEFNLRLWQDKGIAVYGDTSVAGKNDFKPVEGGYYLNENNERGEYRYHGFTAEGNRYSNIEFPNDCDSRLIASQKRWIYWPWDETACGYLDISYFNRFAINGDHNSKVREWLRVDFPLTSTTNPNKDDWNYFNCQTPSGFTNFGEVRGWHDTYGSIWYQTFSIGMLKAEQKNQPATSTTVEILKKPVRFGGLESTTVEIRVTAVLDDSDYTGDSELETLYINRKDVAGAEFSLEGPMLPPGLSPIKIEKFGDGDYRIAATYLVTIYDNMQNRPFDKLTVTGFSKFIYVNNAGESPRTSDSDYSMIDWDDPILCNFNINTEIMLKEASEFTKGHLCYNDASRGDIASYSYVLKHDSSGLSGNFTLSSVNNDAVDTYLYDFIKPLIEAEPEQSFTLTQTVSDSFGRTDSQSRKINIKIKDEPPHFIDPAPQIPSHAFDIVPYGASDKTDMTYCSNRMVFIDGVRIEEFFSGNFIWGDSMDGFHEVIVQYESVDGYLSYYSAWVLVHDTKPVAQFEMLGSFKQNRKLTLRDTSSASNDPYVSSMYPITEYSWKFTGDSSSRRALDISDVYKELLYKEPGFYGVELIAKNSLRPSETYVLNFEILPDNPPAVVFNIWNNVLARGEHMELTYEAVSVDGDSIAIKSFDIYHDENNDGSFSRFMGTFTQQEFEDFEAVSLGRYMVVSHVKEEFGEETIPEYVSGNDRKTSEIIRYFFVDNFRPSTTLYADIPMVLPEVNVFILTDEGIGRAENDLVKNSRMDFNNYLRFQGLLPVLNIWDLFTYEYSASASATRHTGSSYPPSSVYYSSGGYSGTLPRTYVRNDRYRTDEGYWSERTVYKTFNKYHDNTAVNYFDSSGNLILTTYSWGGTNDHPYMTVNEDGYYGDIPKTGWAIISGPIRTDYDDGSYKTETTYRGYYSGTLSKQETYWVTVWVWHNDYTGYYSGTIYKYVRQPYVNPYGAVSENYLIYASNGNVSNMEDFLTVTDENDTEIILIGDETIKQQVPGYSYFIFNDGSGMDNLITLALDYIINSNTSGFEAFTMLTGESFTMSYANFDEEGDPIVNEDFLYVHEPSFYDNSMGQEPGTAAVFDADTGWTETVKGSFTKPGRYTAYRRIKDMASSDPKFSGYNKESNIPFFQVCVNRKPIALAKLDWTYEPSLSVYLTDWKDSSYDPDHQYSREDRGIIERSICLRKDGGAPQYRIPSELEPGSYELEYFVKDVEGYWSEPFTMDFTLPDNPPVQLEASLRPEKPYFTLSGIPASEYVEVYDVWTRYPYDVGLRMAFYDGIEMVTPERIIYYSADTGTKNNSDIYWNNILYEIPADLPDASYSFRVEAFSIDNPGLNSNILFPVTVYTPVNLSASVPGKMSAGEAYGISAQTSIYAEQVSLVMFKDTEYETGYYMSPDASGGSDYNKGWSVNANIAENVPDGTYIAEFIARTPNGNTQAKTLEFMIENLKITGVTIEGFWNHWRGQDNIFGEKMADDPHRFLSLERVKINVHTTGFADRVVIRFSPELEAMSFTDEYGNVYDYSDDFLGYYVNFPEDSTFQLEGTAKDSNLYWEYTLPLAPSSMDADGNVLRQPYSLYVYAYKGEEFAAYEINDINITGNIYDHTYIQPVH